MVIRFSHDAVVSGGHLALTHDTLVPSHTLITLICNSHSEGIDQIFKKLHPKSEQQKFFEGRHIEKLKTYFDDRH